MVGASGFSGGELLRICLAHPDFEIAVAAAASHAGRPIAELHPHLAAEVGERSFDPVDLDQLGQCDVVFLALPHEASAELAPRLWQRSRVVVDLSGAFRLKDPDLYPSWYGFCHPAPELLSEAVFGLVELEREAIKQASLIAVPGCYVTAAALASVPFVAAGLVDQSLPVVVDAASGVSGAGRKLEEGVSFASLGGDFRAYGLPRHRHVPEMEQTIGRSVIFSPHLVPMTRGILATCYMRLEDRLTDEEALGVAAKAYEGCRFVRVQEQLPSTKATLGSNLALLSCRVDQRTGWLIGLCAIDNLVKGAAGQAVQAANLAMGLAEEAGLTKIGIWP